MAENTKCNYVLFNITMPEVSHSLHGIDLDDALTWPSQALISVALGLARQGVGVTVLLHPRVSQYPHSQEGLPVLREMGAEIIEEEDDRNIGTILDHHRYSACVVYNGVWAVYTQAQCRRRNVGVVFVEASPFTRSNGLFIDTIGVTHFSSLQAFRPTGLLPPDCEQTIQCLQEQEVHDRPRDDPYILVLLEHPNTDFFPYLRRYSKYSNLIEDMSMHFATKNIAVRPHPQDSTFLEYTLPSNCFWAREGSLFAWAQYCEFSVGFSSKSTFVPLIFGKPVVVLGRGLTNFFTPSAVFIESNSVFELSTENIAARFSNIVAKEFICFLNYEHHINIADNEMPAVSANRQSSLYRRLLLGESC